MPRTVSAQVARRNEAARRLDAVELAYGHLPAELDAARAQVEAIRADIFAAGAVDADADGDWFDAVVADEDDTAERALAAALSIVATLEAQVEFGARAIARASAELGAAQREINKDRTARFFQHIGRQKYW